MLQVIRSTAGSWVIKILFVFLIASFAVWGVGDMFQGGAQSSTVAQVGPREIGRQELDTEFRRQMDRLRPIFGGSLTTEQARQFGLVDQSINAIVQRTLFDLAAGDAGLTVSDALVRRKIGDEPAFRDPQGKFDPNQFAMVLRNNGLSEAAYVAILRQETARLLVTDALTTAAVAPKPLVEALHSFRGEKRVAETISLPNASVGDIAAPDDATVQKYYDDHSVRFTAPEYRALTVAVLSPDDLAKDIQVADDQLRAFYDQHADSYRVPEKRNIQMALVGDEETAKTIAAGATTGTLAEAAKAANTELIPLDNIARADLPELGDAIFGLESGKVSAPIRSGLGWHVVQVTAVTPASDRPFEQARDDVLAEVRKEKALDRVFELSNRIEDDLASGASLDEVATKNSLAVTKIAAADATGRTPAGIAADVPGDRAQVMQTAFGLASGATSQLIEAAGNRFFAVRVDGITLPALRPLAEVKDEVVKAWQDEQRGQRAAAKAEEIAAALRGGAEANAQSLATDAGGSFAMTAPFARDARSVEGLTPDLLTKLFAAKPGEVVTGVSGDAQVVARLKEVIPADPAAVDPTLSTTVAQGMTADLVGQFTEALRARFPVTIHQDRIAQMYASGN